MTIKKLYEILDDCCNDIRFEYKGKPSGVMPEVENMKRTYHLWFGDDTVDCYNVDDVINAAFFDGSSIKEIIDDVEIYAD